MSLSFNNTEITNHQTALASHIASAETLQTVATPISEATTKSTTSTEPRKLAPSLWLRAMTDFDAPFGRDGLPTVWD